MTSDGARDQIYDEAKTTEEKENAPTDHNSESEQGRKGTVLSNRDEEKSQLPRVQAHSPACN